MKIFRVTLQTEMLVEAADEREAQIIAYRNLEDEVRNRNSEIYRVELLESTDQLRRHEQASLPWRHSNRRDMPELTAHEILTGKHASG